MLDADSLSPQCNRYTTRIMCHTGQWLNLLETIANGLSLFSLVTGLCTCFHQPDDAGCTCPFIYVYVASSEYPCNNTTTVTVYSMYPPLLGMIRHDQRGPLFRSAMPLSSQLPRNADITSWSQLLTIDNHAILRCAFRSFLRALHKTKNEHDIYEALVALLFLPTATANAVCPQERAFYLSPQGRLLFEKIVSSHDLEVLRDPTYNPKKSGSAATASSTSRESGGEALTRPQARVPRRSTRTKQGRSSDKPPASAGEWERIERIEFTTDGSASADTSSARGM